MKSSIHNINQGIIGALIIVDLSVIIWMTQYHGEPSAQGFSFFILAMNLLIFILHILINSRYWHEHDKLLQYFSTFVREKKEPVTFPQSGEFFENARFLSLFKRTYIEQKLQRKDFNEFKKVFDTFIPREIYEKIGFRGYERIVLGTAERRKLTIMFLDIMKFTTVSETISDPYRALLLLNIYFDGIGEIIYRYHGYIDKYLGDGILALFDEENTDDAVRAAIEIQEFIKKFQISTIGRYIEIGIGINTGNVIMGTIGTKRRMDITVIGDIVNSAARLESLTREKDYKILISDNTLKSIRKKELFSLHDLGDIELQGKKEKVHIYGVDMFENVELPS